MGALASFPPHHPTDGVGRGCRYCSQLRWPARPSTTAQRASSANVYTQSGSANNRHVRALSSFHFCVGLYFTVRQRSLVHAARANLNLRFGGRITLPCVSPSCHFLKGFTSSFLEAGCFASFLFRKRQRGCQTLTRRMLRPLLALCTAPRH